jgi:LPXTG-motif cell wall-anchored protein
MKKFRRLFAGIAALAFVLALSMPVAASAAGEEFTVHVKTEWAEPGLWAWSAPDGTNVFAAWPGEKLLADENNEGWFSYTLPTWTNSMIVNEGFDGGLQTTDISIEPKELWFTVTEADADGKYGAEVVYEAPEGFVTAVDQKAPTEDMPKTGDTMPIYMFLGLASFAGLTYLTAKKTKTA